MKILGIVLYVLAGIFIMSGLMMPGMAMGERQMQIVVAAVMMGAGLVPLIAGAALRRRKNWRQEVGIVVLVAAVFVLFAGVQMLAVMNTKEGIAAFDAMDARRTNIAIDYWAGGITCAIAVLIGIACIAWGRAHRRRMVMEPSDVF